jgi:predicted nucleic acid-binding protein
MSGFLLDTNIPSEMLRPRPDANVEAWLKRQANETLFISVVTMGELRRGIWLFGSNASVTR